MVGPPNPNIPTTGHDAVVVVVAQRNECIVFLSTKFELAVALFALIPTTHNPVVVVFVFINVWIVLPEIVCPLGPAGVVVDA